MIRTHRLSARGITAVIDLDLGQVAELSVTHKGRSISPWARVAWADAPDDPARFPADMAPHLRRMSGDFFCAPFCADDVEGAPPHGWTANSAWTLLEETPDPDGVTARFGLGRTIAGAKVEKIWRLRDDHPFLYQRHIFHGGHGRIPVAHHTMVDLRGGGRLRFSPKSEAQSPAQSLETPDGLTRSVLQYPARTTDLTRFPARGGAVDLLHYPIAERHEDFVMILDAPGAQIGWATIQRPVQGDVAILVKSAPVQPQTMLWFSNGGRDFPPWNGDHVGVLGIEEACSYGGQGWTASVADNPFTERGIPTALDLGAAASVAVSYAMGATAQNATARCDIEVDGDAIRFADGHVVPFDRGFIEGQ